jgi:hypothetical protein
VSISSHLRTNRKIHPLVCLECETEFKGYRPTDKYCTASCRWKHKDRKPERNQYKKDSHKKWREANADYRRTYDLMRTYGLTPQQYEDILASQGGGCAICGKTAEEEGRNLAVDHDHKTGEIYGILCGMCNKILVGHIRVPSAFARAAEYLTEGTGLFVPDIMKKGSPRKRKKKVVKTNTRGIDVS